jgi:hypothetical protein
MGSDLITDGFCQRIVEAFDDTDTVRHFNGQLVDKGLDPLVGLVDLADAVGCNIHGTLSHVIVL